MEHIVGKYMYLQLVGDHPLVAMSHSASVESHLRSPVTLEIPSRSTPMKHEEKDQINPSSISSDNLYKIVVVKIICTLVSDYSLPSLVVPNETFSRR